MTAPTPAWPVPSMSRMSRLREGPVGDPDAGRQVLHDLALDVGLGEPARDVDRAHLAERFGQPEDLLHEDRVLVGRDAVLDDRPLADRLQEAGRQAAPLEAVEDAQADRGLAPVLPGRGEVDMTHPAPPVDRQRAPRSEASSATHRPRIQLRLAVLRSMSWIASRSRASGLGLDRVRLEIWPEALHDVGHEAQEDARVGHEELRLVVVADEGQAALQDAALLDVRDLRREVVALDAVGVVEEVQRVVDGEAEPRPPGDEPLVDLGRDADLGDLVEHLRRDGQQPDQRRPGARPEHHLQAALEGEHLRVEARAGDDVGQQVLDVVEHARLRHGVGQVEDLLLEQELLFVIEHAGDGSTGPLVRRPGRRQPDHVRPEPTGRGRASPWRRRRARPRAGRPRSACRSRRAWRWPASRRRP